MLARLGRTVGRIATFEENAAIGGFGSGVMEALSEEGVVMPVRRTGLPDRFLGHASQKALRQETGLGQGRHQEDCKAVAKLRIDTPPCPEGPRRIKRKGKNTGHGGRGLSGGTARPARPDRVVDEEVGRGSARPRAMPYVGYGGVKLERTRPGASDSTRPGRQRST